nr:FAD:protein FMN transferase [Tenacibaculum agarivorans]
MKKFIVIFFLYCITINAQQVFNKTVKLMGCRFDIVVVADSENIADKHIYTAIQEIKRIENLISSWNPSSQTSKINLNAGITPVKVDSELFQLIKRSKKISQLTDGAFDISFASIHKLWKFDGTTINPPTKESIQLSVSKINFKNILLNEEKQTVFLKEKGMKIAFGAIGKGYVADKAKKLLQSEGVVAGIINASGDMNTWGEQPNGDPWKVAITNPMDKSKSFGTLPISNQSIVTSGNYEKFLLMQGKRYSHIIDPRTGYPTTGILSVSVIAPKAELADALATSIFVIGKEIGLDRINQLKNVECIIIDDEGGIHYSENIQINKNKTW